MLLAADVVAAALLFAAAGQLRFGDAEWTTMWQAWGMDLRLGAAVYATAWVTILWYLGLYAFRVRWTIAGELGDIVVASFILAFGTMSFLFLVKLGVSRLFLLTLLLAQPLVTIAGRLALRLFFNWLRAHGYNHCHMLVIGVGEEAQAFANAVEAHRELGIGVIGHLRAPGEADGVVTRPILGRGEELGRIFHERIVDEVAICIAPGDIEWAEPLIRLAADEGKHVRIPTTIPAATFDLQTEEFDGLLVRSYIHGPTRMLSLALKRAMDVAGAALGLVLLSPVFLATAIAVRQLDGRPILFHQTRVGLHGRPFKLHKFRTMDRDAEGRLAEVRHLNDHERIVFKATNDPRVTRLGRTLRATSVDELPQLWNVLKGDMSLIGPRPPLVGEVAEYDVWHRRRLSMRPGITGLWQVEARREREFDRWVERDLAYIDGWSLLLDLKVLLRTVPAVLGRTGK